MSLIGHDNGCGIFQYIKVLTMRKWVKVIKFEAEYEYFCTFALKLRFSLRQTQDNSDFTHNFLGKNSVEGYGD